MAQTEPVLHKADAGYLLTAAISHRTAGNYHKALDCLSALIETTKPNDYYYHLRSSTYSRLNKFDLAASGIKQAL
ncbi:MAG: hypothetical protein KZQ96_20660 [Candidatus Thiodiazotropha sp. (ex Lucinoma borealis)]|nr:hypothetical protein [Candidatus Thiodiazotropha sp. (ex Lucinoma borealis)]